MHHHPPLEADRLAAIDHQHRIEAAKRRAATRREADVSSTNPPPGALHPFGWRLRHILLAGAALIGLSAVGVVVADAVAADTSPDDESIPHGVITGSPPMYQ